MAGVFFSDVQLREMREHIERATGKSMPGWMPLDVYIRLMRVISAAGDKPEEVRRELLLFWDYAAWRYYQSVRVLHPYLPDFPRPLNDDDPEPRFEWQIERDKTRAEWKNRIKRDPTLARPPDGNVNVDIPS